MGFGHSQKIIFWLISAAYSGVSSVIILIFSNKRDPKPKCFHQSYITVNICNFWSITAKVKRIVNEYERSQENIAKSVVRTIDESKKETEQGTLAIKNNFDVEASKLSSNRDKIREVFHMDVAEIIIEREQQRP